MQGGEGGGKPHLKSTFEVSCEAAKAKQLSLTRHYPRKYVQRQSRHRKLRAIAGSQRALVPPVTSLPFRRNVPNK